MMTQACVDQISLPVRSPLWGPTLGGEPDFLYSYMEKRGQFAINNRILKACIKCD